MKAIWVVDDDRSIRWVLEKALQRENLPFRMFEDAADVIAALQAETPSVLLSDIRMKGTSGMELLHTVKKEHPEVPVIIMTAFSDLDSAVNAFQGGAYEYLAKPFDINRAIELLRRACEESGASETPQTETGEAVPEIIGQSAAMQEVFRAIGRLSQSNVTVLVTGESGTGKEVVARALHNHSPRRSAPFVAINNFSATKRGPLRGQTPCSTGALSRLRAARSFWTKSATCRWRCRRGFCAFCRTGAFTASGAVS